MKRALILFTIIALSSEIFPRSSKKKNQPENIFIIGCSWGSGLFAHLFGVLNKLDWCERNNKIPYVHWDVHSHYFEHAGYNGSLNAWEYYFEQVSSAKPKFFNTIYRDYWAPDKTGIEFRSFDCSDILSYKFWAYRLIRKYIRIKPNIIKKINDFYTRYMTKNEIIGIHIRGTDKGKETPRVPITQIIDEAKKYDNENVLFFVATDEYSSLEAFIKAFPNKVIYYNAHRSHNEHALHSPESAYSSKALLGEEVLIEVQLLSRCRKLIHTCSNVSCAVVFFNPMIENILLINNS